MDTRIARLKRQVRLTFEPGGAVLGSQEERQFRSSLSALLVLDEGRTLLLGGDETVRAEPSLERLSLQPDSSYAAQHSFPVASIIDLPDDSCSEGRVGEIDIEGLDEHQGYLWVTGSHCCNRKRPKPEKPEAEQIQQLASVGRQKNRFFLGRIPLVTAGGASVLQAAHVERRAARFKADWIHQLARDSHLGPFLKGLDSDQGEFLPSKDNGLDVEGLAVSARPDGSTRLLLGLRGPVLRGFALVLELCPALDDHDRLVAAPLPGVAARYRKHFLDLRGLGVRDLGFVGDDVWILAGPTMALDAQIALFRWHQPFVSPRSADTITHVADRRLTRELLLPTLSNGSDHAETFAILKNTATQAVELMVVYDAPSQARLVGTSAVYADVFEL